MAESKQTNYYEIETSHENPQLPSRARRKNRPERDPVRASCPVADKTPGTLKTPPPSQNRDNGLSLSVLTEETTSAFVGPDDPIDPDVDYDYKVLNHRPRSEPQRGRRPLQTARVS